MVLYASYDSPFGLIEIGYESNAVVSIRRYQGEFHHIPSPLSELANSQLQEYFCGKRTSFDFPMRPKGTPFQMEVWQALSRIPYAQTQTYGQIAAEIGKPKAARAVGMACNRNPLWIAVPCHRVVGANQKLTGYAGGLAMKQALLDLEQNR
ncbi:MAG: methylated-DNA--[Oscillospiraceae bacterium]|nr:methylated-DNA--[protein]-cysteine S-methyltransferase [Oscillospiraceae bacterium]